MTRHDLSTGAPPALAALPALYLLGVGGPEDASGIGDVNAFVWRFVVVETAAEPHTSPGSGTADEDSGATAGLPVVLAFSAMPKLMQFTRAVNSRAPFTVPTEALRLTPRDLGGGAPAVLVLDPSAADFDALRARGRLAERRIAALEGGAGG